MTPSDSTKVNQTKPTSKTSHSTHNNKPPNLFTLLLFFAIPCLLGSAGAIGVNWGTMASHPLPAPKVVELLKSNNVSRVKLFDADPLVLQALSASNILVTAGIPNSMLKTLNSSRKAAESWVHDNVIRCFSHGGAGVRFEYVAVGDEPFLQSYGEQFHPFVIGAAMNIQAALTRVNLGSELKVVVPCSFDTFVSESTLPSKGHFRTDLNKTTRELLTFLSRHHSPFFVSIASFISFQQNKNIPLDFTLFKKNVRPHNDSHRTYKNSFDLSYDTPVTALSKIGFPDIDIVVARIGWPTDGTANATSSVAETFMKGLVDHLHSKTGTPLRPWNLPIETFIFSLLDEDQRSITSGNGQAKYHVNFGQGSKNLVNAQFVKYLPSTTKIPPMPLQVLWRPVWYLIVLHCLLVVPVPRSVGLVIYHMHLTATISSMIRKADSCDFWGFGSAHHG